MTAQHKLHDDTIDGITLEMNYLETRYPSPRFPRPPAPDGNGFGRTAYMLAYTVVTGDYPVLERNVENPGDAGASVGEDVAARVAALQARVEILGVVGRLAGTFLPGRGAPADAVADAAVAFCLGGLLAEQSVK